MASARTEQDVWMIGRWRFDPIRGTLSHDTDVRRLEHRAAETLAHLCRRRGEVVARDELLNEVWQGRAVSLNSVAVVIADLRRAMDDDARAPVLLETVAKRGYRLLPEAAPEKTPPRTTRRRVRPVLVAGGAVSVLLIALALLFGRPHASARMSIAVTPVGNETGLVRDAALANSLSDLLVDQLARDDRLTVVQEATAATARPPASEPTLSSRLVLWNGLPTLHMTVSEPSTGQVIWSGMAVADADHIAAATIDRLVEFRRRLRSRPAA